MYYSKFVHNTIILSSVFILFIWGLPHTIFIRNILMVIGASFSAYYLWQNREIFFQKSALSICLVFSIILWVILHYLFLSNDPVSQLTELKSLWVRASMGMLIATACALLIQKKNPINQLFPIGFFGMSLIIILLYIYHSWQLNHLITPSEFLDKFVFDRKKVSTAFFSVVDIAVGCAFLSTLLFNQHQQFSYRISFTMLILMFISLSASLVANSKNGMAVGIILLSLFTLTLLKGIFLNQINHKKNAIIFTLILLIMLVTEIAIHKNSASPGWDSLIADIKVSIDIDQHKAWQGIEPLPKNSYGNEVPGNTYERFSWMAAGLRTLLNHPLGYGTINQASFPKLIAKDGLTIENTGSTHSGWLDFALAFGFPVIILAFSAIVINLKSALLIRQKPLWINLSIWISIGTLLGPIVQEVTNKHTFEALMFMLAFTSASIIKTNQE